MKLCLVSFAAPAHGIGGLQDVLRDLAEGAAVRGHEVHVVTARHPDGIEDEERAGVVWHYVDEAAARERLPGRSTAWLRASAACFERLDLEHRFDLVHSESTSALGVVRFVSVRPPLVVRFHGNVAGELRATARRARLRPGAAELTAEAKSAVWATAAHLGNRGNVTAFRHADVIVPSRQQVADTRRSHRLDATRLHVVPNGVDERAFAPDRAVDVRPELGLPAGRGVLLCAGRLEHDKGFHVALRALARLAAPRPHLVVVGDGPRRQALEGEAAALGIVGDVTFVGAVPPDEMPRWLASADAFVFPTLRDEAASVILLQALASGVPVIASRSGAVAEVIAANGTHGLLVDPGDHEALATSVRRVLSDSQLHAELGRGGRRRVLERYTVDAMVDGVLAVHAEVAARRPVAGGGRR